MGQNFSHDLQGNITAADLDAQKEFAKGYANAVAQSLTVETIVPQGKSNIPIDCALKHYNCVKI